MSTKYASLISTSALLILFFALSAGAQTEQLLPEVDTYVKIHSHLRLFFLAQVSIENDAATQAAVGPNIDIFLKPWMKLKGVLAYQLDESKSRPLTFRVGYNYIPSTDGPTEQRVLLEGTGRAPFVTGTLWSNRVRVDLRFIDDSDFSWRFRDRLSVERNFKIHSFKMIPYVRVEFLYDSRYSKWSSTAVTAGSVFPIRKQSEFEVYYEHDNNTGNSPNQQVNALGLALSLYF